MGRLSLALAFPHRHAGSVVQCAANHSDVHDDQTSLGFRFGTPDASLQPTCVSDGNCDLHGRVLAAIYNPKPSHDDETYPARDWWRPTPAEGEFGFCPGHHQEQH